MTSGKARTISEKILSSCIDSYNRSRLKIDQFLAQIHPTMRQEVFHLQRTYNPKLAPDGHQKHVAAVCDTFQSKLQI